MRRDSAVTLIGLLLIMGLFVSIICGLVYVAGKILDTGRTIQARRDAQLTNDSKLTLVVAVDPVIERLTAMPALVLAPREAEMSDRAFLKWADSCQTWAVVYRETLADPWQDTGNRLYGASGEVKAMLLDLSRYEAFYTGQGFTKDGRVRLTGFYGWCAEGDVPEERVEK